jgi:uncharacterized membrane protein YhhN
MNATPQERQPDTPAHKRPRPSRDRRIRTAMVSGLIGVLAIGLIMLGSALLARYFHSSFLNGFRLGVGITLPVGLLAMVWNAYRQMDEYGRSLHTRAATAGFVAAMLASSMGFVVEAQGYGRLPLWGVYVIGMLGYALGTVVLSRQGRR